MLPQRIYLKTRVAGFLDTDAPSIEAEYIRYIDPDIRGKILFQNVFRNILGIPEANIYVPPGPLGPERSKAESQEMHRYEWVNVGLKWKSNVQHLNIVHPKREKPLKCWSFGRLLYTQKGRAKRKYDFAFLIGIQMRALGDPFFLARLR